MLIKVHIILIWTLMVCFSAKNPSALPFTGLFSNLFGDNGYVGLGSNIFRQGLNTAGDTIRVGADTGGRLTNFGIQQARDWSNTGLDTVGRGANITGSLFGNLLNGVQRIATAKQSAVSQLSSVGQNGVQDTANIVGSLFDIKPSTPILPAIGSICNVNNTAPQKVSELETEVSKVRQTVQSLSNNSWIREVHLNKIKELQKDIETLKYGVHSNNSDIVDKPITITSPLTVIDNEIDTSAINSVNSSTTALDDTIILPFA